MTGKRRKVVLRPGRPPVPPPERKKAGSGGPSGSHGGEGGRPGTFGPDRKAAFLDALSASGGDVKAACLASGVHWGTVYRHRHKDAEFDADVQALQDDRFERTLRQAEAELGRDGVARCISGYLEHVDARPVERSLKAHLSNLCRKHGREAVEALLARYLDL